MFQFAMRAIRYDVTKSIVIMSEAYVFQFAMRAIRYDVKSDVILHDSS